MDEVKAAGRDTMQQVFNYRDVFFSFFYDGREACVHRSPNFALNYVYSGEMVLDNGRRRIAVRAGECVFIPRDHHITMWKRPAGGERYCGIFMMFTRTFLKEMYARLPQAHVPADTPKLPGDVMLLPGTPGLLSLFASMTPYFDTGVRPHDDLMRLKMEEGLLTLLHIDRRFAPMLFDFNEPWKIDILDFMNRNYMCEMTLDELARYTGRSLATFKRDFRKLSDLTPEKWLIRKRLEVAYAMMKEGRRKIADVCAAVGFKNQSHFSTAFKRMYGVPPTAV